MDSNQTGTKADEPGTPDFLRPGAAPAEGADANWHPYHRELHFTYASRNRKPPPTPQEVAAKRFELVGWALAAPFFAVAAIPAAPGLLLLAAAEWLGKWYTQRTTRPTE